MATPEPTPPERDETLRQARSASVLAIGLIIAVLLVASVWGGITLWSWWFQ
jgi:hypothetical protein